MTLDEAVRVWQFNGWKLEQKPFDDVAHLVYDEGGGLARSLDRRKGGGMARAALIAHRDGTVESKMLNKATTNLLGYHRYLRGKNAMKEAQSERAGG